MALELKPKNRNAGSNTVIKNAAKEINTIGHMANVKMGSKIIRFILLLGTSYVITYNYITVLFKDIFFIASWGNIITLYIITLLMAIVLYFLYNIIIKLLITITS